MPISAALSHVTVGEFPNKQLAVARALLHVASGAGSRLAGFGRPYWNSCRHVL